MAEPTLVEKPELTVLRMIKSICNDSNYPHKTVTTCLSFVDSLISQIEPKKEDHAERKEESVAS